MLIPSFRRIKKKNTKLLKHHRGVRLKWDKNVMSWDDEGKQIIFPYEKKITLTAQMECLEEKTKNK